MTPPRRYLYLPPVPRVRPAGSWNPLIGFRKVVRPQSVPVGRFLRPVQGIPLTGGQGATTISAGGATGIPAVVQSKIASANGLSLSFTNPTTAGNCVLVGVGAFGSSSGNIPGVTGATLGGAADHFASVTAPVSAFIGGFYELAALWADPNCAGGQTAVAVTGNANLIAGQTFISIYEVSQLLTSGLVDQVAAVGASSGGTAWSSGATPTTTQANELWFGAGVTVSGITGTPASPWTNLEVGNSFITGYQVVSATGAATYAGTQSAADAWAALAATFKAAPPSGPVAGTATISVGPQGLGNVWYPAQITVQTSSGVSDASTCSIYLGPAGVPVTLVATIFPGGIGTAALAVPPLQPGDYLIAQWTGGNPGDAAAVNVIGTMDSLMPG